MFKIYVKNLITGEEWWEYGFSKRIMKSIVFYSYCREEFEIIWCHEIIISFDTFKKCLLHKKKICKNLLTNQMRSDII